MQAVSVEAQDRPHPSRRQVNAGPYQQILRGPQQKRGSLAAAPQQHSTNLPFGARFGRSGGHYSLALDEIWPLELGNAPRTVSVIVLRL